MQQCEVAYQSWQGYPFLQGKVQVHQNDVDIERSWSRAYKTTC